MMCQYDGDDVHEGWERASVCGPVREGKLWMHVKATSPIQIIL